MNLYTLCAFCFFPTALANLYMAKFHYPKDDWRFDFIVGITVDNQSVGIGAMIKNDTVVTSANPLESYLTNSGSTPTAYHDPGNRIHVYGVTDNVNTNRRLVIERFAANVSKRNKTWVRMGFNRTHSPIHDLLFIIVNGGYWNWNRPRDITYLDQRLNNFRNGWTFAGFGYLDEDHVKNNTVLESSTYEDSDQVDCDEWIPRAWGRFICLLNVDNVMGIQSGAPLMYNGELYGVGSFALKKGKESILVFTDFTLYSEFVPSFTYVPSKTMTTKSPFKNPESKWWQFGR